MMIRRIPVVLVVAFAAVFCGQCSSNPVNASGDAVATEPYALQFPTNIGRLTGFRLEGISGDIQITGRPVSSEVEISAVKRVRSVSVEDAEAHLDELDIVLSESGDDAVISTVEPDDTEGRSYSVDYTIVIPEDFVLTVTNTNGDIIVQNVNSSVTVANTNGQIDLLDIAGDADAMTTNGNVEVQFQIPPVGTVNLVTTNGGIQLDIPVATSASLSAVTANGDVTITGLTLTDATTSANSAEGTLGSGTGTITLATTNGDIDVNGL